ncbi:Ornithine carbamoyltransferase [Caulifigura coniformis]|uniref:Ornithine carbamoyltransferase n=1 Tax=Caulifigura coniformis TaxID=2527983 RepID=A0A517S9Q7_9PLAN|nr:ornithine carbamoyltransferase [Caulifigura coniformis]QDT52867.1 Ornithine carbamoyltransferase [Caulifigura coniformis]
MKNLTTMSSLEPKDTARLLELAAGLKQKWAKGERPALLENRVLTQVFEKPSLRTRVSFEAAMQQLGGSSIFLSSADAGLNGRESTADVARVLGSYSDAIVLRTFKQDLIEDFAKYSRSPVINGLSDDDHPCQALTDLFTMQEHFGPVKGLTLAYVGDGNNVARSLAIACAQLGVHFHIGAPQGYQLSEQFEKDLKARYPSFVYMQTDDAKAAVKGAQIVYTDVWASMGQEAEKEHRARVFASYQVNSDLMKAAGPKAKFMHCLPARRGLEVTDEVMESPASIVFPQAENRMHLAKAVLVDLILPRKT